MPPPRVLPPSKRRELNQRRTLFTQFSLAVEPPVCTQVQTGGFQHTGRRVFYMPRLWGTWLNQKKQQARQSTPGWRSHHSRSHTYWRNDIPSHGWGRRPGGQRSQFTQSNISRLGMGGGFHAERLFASSILIREVSTCRGSTASWARVPRRACRRFQLRSIPLSPSMDTISRQPMGQLIQTQLLFHIRLHLHPHRDLLLPLPGRCGQPRTSTSHPGSKPGQ